MTKSLKERFDSKVFADPNSGCWIWGGAINPGGYGMIHDNKMRLAHRVSWEFENGPISEGMCALHKCDVRACVNPDHLYIGTYKDNAIDASNRKRRDVKGEKNPFSKLTASQVREIRDAKNLYYRGLGVDLSRKYSVSKSLIYDIWSNLAWRH